MCDVDGDAADVWRENRQRARKQYQCCECGAPIPAGVHYIYIAALVDGRWSRYRMHAECHALWDVLIYDVCGGHGQLMVQGLGEALLEHDEADLMRLLDDDDTEDDSLCLTPWLTLIRDSYRLLDEKTKQNEAQV